MHPYDGHIRGAFYRGGGLKCGEILTIILFIFIKIDIRFKRYNSIKQYKTICPIINMERYILLDVEAIIP
jgi:hypothetical protein